MEEPLLPRSGLRRYWPVFGLIAILVWESFLARVAPDGPEITNFDKLAHFFVFGLLGTLWFRAVGGSRLDWRMALLALGLTMVNGLCDEWLQSMNPSRSADWRDWLADAFGAAVAIACYRYWSWYRRCLESRLWGEVKIA